MAIKIIDRLHKMMCPVQLSHDSFLKAAKTKAQALTNVKYGTVLQETETYFNGGHSK